MIPLSLDALADVVGGVRLGGAPGDGDDTPITGVCIDSRTVMPGDLFVPLAGEHADGHRFIDQALDGGAAGFLCATDQLHAAAGHRRGIAVDDVLDALTGLGAWIRDEVAPTVVAITGSNGKTTTKDLAAAAIGVGRTVVANPGSFNNEIGLPLTLCLLTADTEVLVCEVGARGVGHIAQVMPMLRPDVAVVTTISGAHLGEFGSIEAIIEAKGELVEALDIDGTAVLNADLDVLGRLVARTEGQVVTFGMGAGADVHPDEVEVDPGGRSVIRMGDVRFTVPVPGLHNVANAMAAIAAAEAVGVDRRLAAEGIERAVVSRWRMEVRTTGSGVVVVNDAYNANPQSMKAALDTVAAMHCAGRRWAALGHMAELGPRGPHMHAGVGAHAAAAGLHGLVVVDPRAAEIAEGARQAGFAGVILQASDAADALRLLLDRVVPGDLVLVKASRSAGLEAVALGLLDRGDAR